MTRFPIHSGYYLGLRPVSHYEAAPLRRKRMRRRTAASDPDRVSWENTHSSMYVRTWSHQTATPHPALHCYEMVDSD
ncbi:hypothetical protein E2C01_057927 [Portunus trituberculatus]|uniref:Uncharacterized protein n=1 Tax=Portunus trituberculatus TaxID=210409 RepID=A0A5B7GU99_PORTR|nr:hypothetical protein [Portunus trituberculatus]